VIGSGGGNAAGGALTLFASAGQPAAGSATGGAYTLRGGFQLPPPGGPVSVPDLESAPLALAIHLASPNPTAGPSTIGYDLPAVGQLALGVYDVGGRLVRSLESAPQAPGRHVAAWDGRDAGGAIKDAREADAGVSAVHEHPLVTDPVHKRVCGSAQEEVVAGGLIDLDFCGVEEVRETGGDAARIGRPAGTEEES
jgi:hypothetical protein